MIWAAICLSSVTCFSKIGAKSRGADAGKRSLGVIREAIGQIKLSAKVTIAARLMSASGVGYWVVHCSTVTCC